MLKTFEVNLDLENQTANSAFTISQNDLKTIEIIFTVTQDKKAVDLTGTLPRIAILKPSGKTVIQDCTLDVDPTKGNFQVILDSQAYVEVGVHTCEVYIYSGDQVAVTGTFTYNSRIGIFSDTTLTSSNDWQAINDALANYMTNDQAKTLIDSIIAQNGGVNLQNYYTKTDVDTQMSSVNEQLADIMTDVKTYGAKGDGITDDTTAIQNAINSLTNGGTLFFPAGTYILSTGINLKSNIHLKGTKGTILKVADSCTGYYGLLNIVSVQNVTISDLTIDGNINRANYDISKSFEIAVYIVNSTNVKVRNNVFNTCGAWTISCETSGTYPYNDTIYIEDNVINYSVGQNTKAVDSTGFSVDNTQMYMDAKNYFVRNNLIATTGTNAETAIEAHRRNGIVEGNIISGFRNGVLIVPGQYAEDSDVTQTRVSGNKIIDCMIGITAWQMPTRDLDNATISTNSIECNPARYTNITGAKGIALLATTPTDNSGKEVKNVLISDNIINFKDYTVTWTDSNVTINFTGIHFKSWVTIENIKIVNNMIMNAPGTGILIGVSSDSTHLNNAKNIYVENNTIVNAGKNTNISTQSYNPRTAIRLNGGTSTNVTNTIIRNNTIIDNNTNATYFTAPTYSAAYDINTCVFYQNQILAYGYVLPNVVQAQNMLWTWDSQSGTPTLTRSGNYSVTDLGLVKIAGTIVVSAMNTFTAGNSSYLTLPYKSSETRCIPIIVTNLNDTTTYQWYLDVKANSQVAYIRGLKSDNTVVGLTWYLVKANTQLSFQFEYYKQ